MVCHALLQGIFLTQELNLGLPHCRQILYCLNHQGAEMMFLLSDFGSCIQYPKSHSLSPQVKVLLLSSLFLLVEFVFCGHSGLKPWYHLWYLLFFPHNQIQTSCITYKFSLTHSTLTQQRFDYLLCARYGSMLCVTVPVFLHLLLQFRISVSYTLPSESSFVTFFPTSLSFLAIQYLFHCQINPPKHGLIMLFPTLNFYFILYWTVVDLFLFPRVKLSLLSQAHLM